MNEGRAERILGVFYIFSTILSVTSLTCLATAWQYWTWTLDVCIGIDCGCILYGVNIVTTFTGGNAKFCHFAVYSLIPAILVGLCLGGYYGYRSCINRNLDAPVRIYDDSSRTLNNREVTTTVVIRPKRRPPCKQWIPVSFLAMILCCLSLAHAIVTTDGYYGTCQQYRKRLIQLLGSTGREAKVVHNRLSCGAIFDFMDYLQTDVNNWNHAKEANTGFTLGLAIISSWLNFLAWAFVFLVNIIMGRKKFSCC